MTNCPGTELWAGVCLSADVPARGPLTASRLLIVKLGSLRSCGSGACGPRFLTISAREFRNALAYRRLAAAFGNVRLRTREAKGVLWPTGEGREQTPPRSTLGPFSWRVAAH
ncbi:hypothetical protein AAFF_G00374390 [Aldrovandia affinis]|uniref:Uncharacterized protein n=1 Tax=Aldrovandia affinis TaxID=143900 RepID=A0AAD7SG53_9TELE|nr:hypothetical protein AAFF_G00374390 [Aldrovandia affinis]